MNRALSASDLPLVMWLCGHLNPVETPPTLPQHILLCLVQQFGASDLLEDTVREENGTGRDEEGHTVDLGFLFWRKRSLMYLPGTVGFCFSVEIDYFGDDANRCMLWHLRSKIRREDVQNDG